MELYKIGFKPSKADTDLWMRDAGDHYEFVGKYSDDLMVMARDPMKILERLMQPRGPYKMKGVGTPEYYLGGDVKIVYKNDRISEMLLNAKTYVTQLTKKIEDLMEWTLRHYTHPGDPKYHPEIDETEFLVGDEVSKYRTMVGSLNWLVALGRYDIL